jgi:acyl dehydratase
MSSTLTATRAVTSEDIDVCTRITGDSGSHHVNGLRGRRMAPGILTLSAVPLLGSPGVHMRELSFRFLAPVYAGQTITATVDVTETAELPGDLVRLCCQVSVVNADGITVLTGSGVAELSREQAKSELSAGRTEGV